MTKVLVLYMWSGVGHYREAKAIADELSKRRIHTTLINPLSVLNKNKNPVLFLLLAFHPLSNFCFKWYMTFFTTLQKKEEKVNHLAIKKQSLSFYKSMHTLIGQVAGKALNINTYDVVITTHPGACAIAIGALGKNAPEKIINVCPDETQGITAFFYLFAHIRTFVNSESTKSNFIKIGADTQNIFVLGHPLDPLVYKHKQHIFNRVQEALKRGQVSVGLYLGGFTPKSQIREIINTIVTLSQLISKNQIAVRVLSGPHKSFKNKLLKTLQLLGIENKVTIEQTVSLEGVIRVGHDWMIRDITVMASRPSELIFYSLATGIPHILFTPLGDQEAVMRKLIRHFAPVKDLSEIKDDLAGYLTNTNELLSLSKDLYNNTYSLNGAIHIADYVTKAQ